MASWFKKAEDLFEVVDRRAKLVVSELADEEAESKTPASNGQGTQRKRTKSRPKAHKLQVANASPISSDVIQDKAGAQTELVDEKPGKDKDTLTNEVDGTDMKPSAANSEQKSSASNPSPLLGKPLSELPVNDVNKHDIDNLEVRETDSRVQAVSSSETGEEKDKNALEINKDVNQESKKGYEVSNEETPLNTENINKSGEDDSVLKIDQQKSSESVTADTISNGESPLKNVNLKAEPIANQNNQQESKATDAPANLQDPLDEAQGLLKTANATGKSKEARLARVCAGLSSRLQELKSENAQLEELLAEERELSKSYEARIKQLEEYLYESKNEVSKVESSMVEALAAKNSEIEALLNSMDALKKQAAASEGNLASLQANMESIMRNRELTETRMMQALREELASVERRAEEERAAHNATKMAAMEREVELEQRAVEASTALARIQRVADERTTRAAELEQKIALLEVECASLNQELQDMEARVRRGQKKLPDEVNQMLQAWQEEVERAHQGQRDAESKLSSLEAEMQKMRVEMAAMKRDAEHYSQQEHVELEKRYRELTDLLYYKQTQLETMASEKSAAEFQLEKEIRRLQEAQVEAERNKASRRGSSTWEDDSEIKALEPLPIHHRHIAGASIQLQKAAKLLDSGAVRATRFLWRHPIARVFVHLFLMYLLHRLQEQADDFAARELAESMGLSNRTLP